MLDDIATMNFDCCEKVLVGAAETEAVVQFRQKKGERGGQCADDVKSDN